jgi:para-nitrobenzyl esterase
MAQGRARTAIEIIALAAVAASYCQREVDSSVHIHGAFAMTHQDHCGLNEYYSRRLMMQLSAALFAATALPAGAETSLAPLRTTHGRLRGRLVDGIATYHGIPYGAPTGGANRFLPPQPAARWTGVRDAAPYGHQSPQVLRLKGIYPFPEWIDPETASEDCLNLNVWAPAARAAPRPVMVWLHGGGYARGSGNIAMYDGHRLAKRGDVIVVNVNHRLNIFGFAHVAKGADARFATSGNAGMLDLVAALQWVRANIAAFGGDAGNVTIFGESGGGGKVSCLLAMPAAKGLFHKAIVMSGSMLEVLPAEDADAAAAQVYAYFKLQPGDPAGLQRVPTGELYDCYEKLTSGAVSGVAAGLQFGPMLDGISIPQQTWTPNAPSLAHDIPMLIGTSSDETAAFIDKVMLEPIPDDVALMAKIGRYGGRRARDPARVGQLLAVYRAAMPELSRTELLVRITTDLGMWRGAITQAARKHAAGGAPAWLYEFAWKTPAFGGQWALHSLILPFVFGNHNYGKSWDMEDSASVREAADPTHEYLRVGDQVQAIWTQFARTGNPALAALGDWPPYTPETRKTMLIGRQTHLTDGMREAIRAEILAI